MYTSMKKEQFKSRISINDNILSITDSSWDIIEPMRIVNLSHIHRLNKWFGFKEGRGRLHVTLPKGCMWYKTLDGILLSINGINVYDIIDSLNLVFRNTPVEFEIIDNKKIIIRRRCL